VIDTPVTCQYFSVVYLSVFFSHAIIGSLNHDVKTSDKNKTKRSVQKVQDQPSNQMGGPMNIDIDTKCIPLAHVESYLNLRKEIIPDVGWLARRVKHDLFNPEKMIKTILGIDLEVCYRAAGIDYNSDHTNIFISPRQCFKLIDQAIHILKMPYLGLAMGNLMTISHHGMAGMAAVTQPTLLDCMEAICRFCSELFPPLEMYLQTEDDKLMFVISANMDLSHYTQYFFELNTVSFYNIFNHLVANEHQILAVDFSYPEPTWGHIYRRYFKCPVRFNQPQTRLVINAHVAHYELPLANRQMAISAEERLFENIPTRTLCLVPLRLRRLLLRCYGAFPSLESAANNLGMSGRTLSRKLAEDSTTYQQILDAVREKLATEYFSRGGESVTQIALVLGFTDSSNFAKAFRRWTGLSPTEFIEMQHA
jgi:AraC-like DNA-binding protein